VVTYTKPDFMAVDVCRTPINGLDEAVRKVPGGRLPAEVMHDSKAAGEPLAMAR